MSKRINESTWRITMLKEELPSTELQKHPKAFTKQKKPIGAKLTYKNVTNL
jgi:hypothetical protein